MNNSIALEFISAISDDIELSSRDMEEKYSMRIICRSDKRGKLDDIVDYLCQDLHGAKTLFDYSTYLSPQEIGKLRLSNITTKFDPNYFIYEGVKLYRAFIDFDLLVER